MVVWVQNGCVWVVHPNMAWVTGSCGTAAAQHHKSIVLHIATPGKRLNLKVPSIVSTECILLSHHHKVEPL